MHRYRWTTYSGFSGRLAPESVVAFDRITQLRDVWYKIEQSRDFLMKAQGGDPNLFSTILLEFLEFKKEFSSYSLLSKEMNFYALAYLLWANSYLGSNEIRSRGADYFQKLLRTFQIKVAEIAFWGKKGKESLSIKELPWGLTNGPIDERRVIDSLRQFRKKKKKGSIIISPFITTVKLDLVNGLCIGHGYWVQAEDLLRQATPKEFKEFEPILNTIFNDTNIEVRNYFSQFDEPTTEGQ